MIGWIEGLLFPSTVRPATILGSQSYSLLFLLIYRGFVEVSNHGLSADGVIPVLRPLSSFVGFSLSRPRRVFEVRF